MHARSADDARTVRIERMLDRLDELVAMRKANNA